MLFYPWHSWRAAIDARSAARWRVCTLAAARQLAADCALAAAGQLADRTMGGFTIARGSKSECEVSVGYYCISFLHFIPGRRWRAARLRACSRWYASESDSSDVSQAFINASMQTASQMDGTWELATSDGAPHH